MTQLALNGIAHRSTPVLLSLLPRYMEQIRAGEKQYEYRRKYRRDRTTAYIYENAPVSAVTAVLELDVPVVASPGEIAALADKGRPGHGQSIKDYMDGLEVGFAVPIRSWHDIAPVPVDALRRAHSRFAPPQSYMLLDRVPALLDLLGGREA